MIKKTTLYLFMLLAAAQSICAQPLQLEMNNSTGLYHKDETVRMVLKIQGNASPISCTIRENFGSKQPIDITLQGDSAVVVNCSYSKAGAYIVEANAGNQTASLGYVVSAESIDPGTDRPDDFDQYWEQQKQMLASKKLEVSKTSVNSATPGYECYDISIRCPGTKPARGYMARPSNAPKGSLPIVIQFHAAGVDGDWCKAKPEIAIEYAKKGAICFDLNAHGMLNGQPDNYYRDLAKGELSDYYTSGIDSKETIYYKGMYLRLLQCINYVTTLPEWDGKRILVLGESQGGGQALVAAGLDHRITAVAAVVPAMCDWGGYFTFNQGGWPNLFSSTLDGKKLKETLPYFDAAHALKGSKATIWVEIGLIDTTCPSTSIFAAINQSRGKKIIKAVPYRDHHLDQRQYQHVWELTINRSRLEFIDNYLE